MPDRISAFVEAVGAEIRWKKARPLLTEEIRTHLLDQRDACVAQGMAEDEAQAEAVRQMGDPVALGADLDRVHRPGPSGDCWRWPWCWAGGGGLSPLLPHRRCPVCQSAGPADGSAGRSHGGGSPGRRVSAGCERPGPPGLVDLRRPNGGVSLFPALEGQRSGLAVRPAPVPVCPDSGPGSVEAAGQKMAGCRCVPELDSPGQRRPAACAPASTLWCR